MIKNLKFMLALLLVGGFSSQTLFAQDALTDAHEVEITIPEVAILDIEPSMDNDITLAPTAPTEAGAALDFTGVSDNSLWLNYSSIIGAAPDDSRTITVGITTGAVPSGLTLKLAAAADAGTGEGTVGTPAGAPLTLSGTAQTLISAIGSCYTNTPEANGHQLTYSLEYDGTNYGDLNFSTSSTTVEVTYTISDN